MKEGFLKISLILNSGSLVWWYLSSEPALVCSHFDTKVVVIAEVDWGFQ